MIITWFEQILQNAESSIKGQEPFIVKDTVNVDAAKSGIAFLALT